MSSILPSKRFTQDLRSPSFSRFRRGIVAQSLRVLLLLVVDSLLIFLAWRWAEFYGTPTKSPWNIRDSLLPLLPILAIMIGMFNAGGLYQGGGPRRNYIGIIKAVSLAAALILLVAFFYHPKQFVSRSQFLLFWVFSIVLICAGRFLTDWGIHFLRSKGLGKYPVFLISSPEYVSYCTRAIKREDHYIIAGVGNAESLNSESLKETLDRIYRLGIVEIFVSWDALKDRQFLFWHFQTAGITLRVIPIGLEPLLSNLQSSIVGGIPALTLLPPMITGVGFLVKRLFDFFLSLILVTVAFPAYVAIALLIKLDSPGPIFYRQSRIGLHGKPFKVWKFRTMVTNADQLQRSLETRNEVKDSILFKIKDDPRVTCIGKFLRCYSLDELPQLFNVLLGEMSLVGPRPLPLRDVERFSTHHFVRQEVLPGITGLWQVSGRSNITDFEDVVKLDLSYIERWSLWLDLRILLKTVQVVLKKQGAY
jgi:exopolysaccharide biosynthesis polyprenyl glycosylphosphotransferase